MSYRIGRGETGVLTFEPYKSLLLPYWRFRTIPIAKKSSSELYTAFLIYHDTQDFIGMDMARKFIQMGMTRAKRYANHKGGRKYDKDTGVEMDKSTGHEGTGEKEGASLVFRSVWEDCRAHEGYQGLKERFMKEQKEWDKVERREGREPENGCVKKGLVKYVPKGRMDKEEDQEDGEKSTESGKGEKKVKVKKEIKEEDEDT